MSDLENLYIKRNEAYKNNDIETVNKITEELDKLYPVKPKTVLCIDRKPVQFEIIGDACNGSDHKWDYFKPMVNGKYIYKRLLIKRFSAN